jgi:phage tail protein X
MSLPICVPPSGRKQRQPPASCRCCKEARKVPCGIMGEGITMNRGAKIVAASVVLASGLVVALLFKQAAPRKLPPGAQDYGQLVLRNTTGPRPAGHVVLPGYETSRPDEPEAASLPHPPDAGEATFLSPVRSAESPPPPLPRSYPGDDSSATAHPGTSVRFVQPGGNAVRAPRQTHRIADGDTLRSLAERYLGSADRHAEIYEANRELLSSPDILPIGVKLKIPPRRIRSPGS